MIEKVDVLICGSGSAGIAAATWLARCGIRCKILDSRRGPLERGQADGVQCRTVEVYESFGLAEDILREAYHVVEDTFWCSDGDGKIMRTRSSADTQPGLSHQPHLILNQARMNGVLLGAMKKWNDQDVDYGYTVKNVEVDSELAHAHEDAYAVTVMAEKEGEEVSIQARYVLGCDGAHSIVRKSLGYKMVGDSSDAVWGVMDIYPRTNFPDIRKKVVLQTEHGNLLIIPREGGSLVRFYIQLSHGTKAKEVKLEELQATAKKIFAPFEMEFANTYWWSAYQIGQRVADFFSKDNQVFLTGDACHTHSPKAGQGMNTSLQDGYNIGWKLAAVLKGQSPPELLKTYNIEREKVAKTLIDFDRQLTNIWAKNSHDGEKDVLVEHFLQSARYTAGLTAQYDESIITSHERSTQAMAKKLLVGMRFPSSQVVRFCDAKAMQFVKAFPADGRWRLVIFAGEIESQVVIERLHKVAKYLGSAGGPIRKYTPDGADIDSVIEPIVLLSGQRSKFEQSQIPDYFWPFTGMWKMRDLHKVFVDDESYNSGHGHAYDFYGVDPTKGALVIIRPDQYVSLVTTIENSALIGRFFDGFMLRHPQNRVE